MAGVKNMTGKNMTGRKITYENMTGKKLIAGNYSRVYLSNKLKNKFLSTIIILLIASFMLLAQGNVLAKTPQFRLDIDSLNLEKGVSATLTLSMVNAQGAEIIEVKGLENFDVVSTGNSTSTRIINGDTNYQVDRNYIIIPKSTGKFTLQASIKYNGQTYQTNELEINVSETGTAGTKNTSDLFIRTILSSNEIYFGQKVVLTYELYSRYSIEGFRFLDNTDINGFICNDISSDKLDYGYEYIDGNRYIRYKVRQAYLTPVKTGTITIPAFNVQVNVNTGDFFNRTKPFYLQTELKDLTVKPLPQENQPADFSGIVGKLNLESKYDKQEINYGESLVLKVTASGNCNLDSLKEIIKNDILGFSAYQTEKNFEESIENNQYQAKKEFEVILVPKENGKLNIAPIYIPYFDPQSGKYEKAEIPGTTVTVKGEAVQGQAGSASNSSDAQSQAKEDGDRQAHSIETVRIEQVSYGPQKDGYISIQFKKSYLLTGVIIFAILLGIGLLIFLLHLYWEKQDKELNNMYKQLNNSNDKNEIYNLFNKMIKHCFGISLKASSKSVILNQLAGYEIAAPVLEIMDYMENGKTMENGNINLKNKIKGIYKILKKQKTKKLK